MGCGASSSSVPDNEFKSMRGRGLAATKTIDVLLIADQDKESKQDNDGDGKSDAWASSIVHVVLTRHSGKYTAAVSSATPISVTMSDSSGRGAEFSSLCFWNGKLLTCDDRTGGIFSLQKGEKDGKANYSVTLEHTLADADGQDASAGFKAEWMVVKDGNLFVGSHGRIESDPKAKRKDRMRWVKVITPLGAISHVDWAPHFDKIAKGLGVADRGYVTHESALHSAFHNKWFFFPRRISDEPWAPQTDPLNGANRLVAVDEKFENVQTACVGKRDPEQGCADLDFVPGTGHSELISVFTVEKGDVMESFLAVFDLNGKELLPHTKILSGFKLEGLVCMPPL